MASKFLKFLFILYFTIFSVTPSFASSISPLTLPTGGQVASGNININESGPGKLVVNQTTNQGIINWQSFNVGVDAAVHFNTPNVTAGTLNNISGGTSTILGSIFSNGRLFFANPSGIIFKPGSQVKAEGLVASAMRISNQDFLANNFSLTNNQIANLQNEGNLEAQYVALIAPQVLNKGTITSNVATMIAAGDDVKLSISDSNRLSVNINPAKIKTLSSNEGVIKSENGTVSIQANAAQELIDQTINVPRSADSLISENGVIKLVSSSGLIKAKNVNLSAGPLGGTEVSGTIDASSNTKGGDIKITGKEIQVKSNSTLLATGETRGGNILVGGDWQGSNGVLQATYTTVEKDTLIDASSKGIGDGGKIVVWSDINNPNSKTVARGKLYAKANVGDGGKIETSGYALDIENVDSNTSSVQGLYGDYLIDPYNYEIDSAAWNNINSSLNNNNVTISTSSSNTDYGRSNSNDLSGRIDFHSGNRTYTHNRDATLTLNAANKVEIYANISTTSHKLNIVTNTDKVHGSGNLNLGGGTFTVDVSDASATEEYTGTLSNLSLVKDGAGRFNLAGTNTYTGTTTVSAGTLSVTGTLGSGTYAGNIANSATLAMGSSSNQTLSGIISGTGALTKSGSGTLTLSGNNTYSGATTISAGTLAVTANNALGTNAAGTTVASGANLDFQNINYSTIEALTVNGGTIKTSTGTSTVAGTIALGANSTFDVGGTSLTSSGVISGTGALTKSGSGTLTLSGANTYSGGTTLTAGQISLGANQNSLLTPGALGTGTLTMNGGTLGNTSSSGTIYNNILVNTGVTSTLKEIAGSNLHLAGNITGSGTLQVSNTSGWTISLAGDNSGFTGAYIQPSSTVGNTAFFSSTAGSANASWELSGGRFVNEVSGGNISLGSLSSNASSGYLLGSSGGNKNASYTIGGKNLDNTFTGIIENNYPGASNNVLSITKAGTGTLALSGTNTYTGATTINAGTLSASSLADTTAVSVVSGATYRLDQNDTVASIAGAGNIDLQNRTLTSAGASDTNFSGIISGTGALTLTGSNNLTLSGVNTYSGTTHINGGGLVLANSNALASNSITSTSGRFKTTERISDLTVAGDVTLIGDIATTGAQTYNNNVTLGAGSVVNPLTISSQNSDITFSGTVKTGSGAKAAQRSLTVNAGVGNVNFNDRVGYAFNGVGFNAGLTADSPYALSVTGGNITLKGDVMTFETQTYNGAVKIGGNGSNGTTRTLLSMDPKITFNGTVDDIQVNTHTLVAKAVQIRDNVLASGAPEVNFNRQVSSITSLAGYQGLTGYQIVSNEFGSIDPSASFGSVKLPPSSSSSSSNNSQAEQRNIEKKISSLKTNVANSSSNTKTGMTLSQLFSSFNPQAGTSFVKSIEIVYPNSPSFGVEKIKQNLPADAKSENNFNQNKSDQTKPNNQQNQKQNSSDGINDDERL